MGRLVVANGGKVKRLRESRGWRVADLADKSKSSERTIYNVESSKRVYKCTLRRIADLLSVPYSDLVQQQSAHPPSLSPDTDDAFKTDSGLHQVRLILNISSQDIDEVEDLKLLFSLLIKLMNNQHPIHDKDSGKLLLEFATAPLTHRNAIPDPEYSILLDDIADNDLASAVLTLSVSNRDALALIAIFPTVRDSIFEEKAASDVMRTYHDLQTRAMSRTPQDGAILDALLVESIWSRYLSIQTLIRSIDALVLPDTQAFFPIHLRGKTLSVTP